MLASAPFTTAAHRDIGYTPLDSIDKYDRAFMLAILALGKVGFDRFDQIKGELQDDPGVQIFGCRATTMSRKFASHIANGYKMNTESRPIDDVSDGLSVNDATMNSAILQALRHVHKDVLLSLRDDESVAVRAAAEEAYHSGISTGAADAENIAPLATQEEGEEEKQKDAEEYAEEEEGAEEKQKDAEYYDEEACMALVRKLDDMVARGVQYVEQVQAVVQAVEQAPQALAALTQWFRAHIDSDYIEYRSSAVAVAGAVGQIDPTSEFAAEALAALTQCFRAHIDSDDNDYRLSAVEAAGAVGQIDPTSEFAAEALAALTQCFRAHIDSDDWEDRISAVAAADAVGQIAPTSELAAEAGIALIGRLDDGEFVVLRFMAVRALAKMGERAPPQAGMALIGRLDDENFVVRVMAADALVDMGERAPPQAVVALIGLLKDRDATVREAAQRSLVQIVKSAPTEVAKLAVEQWLQHADASKRRLAAETFGKLGQRAPSVVAPALAKTLAMDKSPEVREAVATALRNVVTGNHLRVTAIVDSLLPGLESDSYDAKYQCMCALAQVLNAANRMSKVWTQELVQRFETTPEEIDECVKLVCQGDIEAARFLSRPPPPAAQPTEHSG